LLPLPQEIVGFAFIVAIFLLTGINHADGLVDTADGLVSHGKVETVEAMKDSSVGVGGLLALGLLLVGLYSVGTTLPDMGRAGLGLVIAAEVGAKLGMTVVIGLGSTTHDGLGRTVAGNADRRTVLTAFALSLPAATLTVPSPSGAIAILAGLVVGVGTTRWADRTLGTINGDVMGATNELARIAALYAGVIVWTVS
jgi:adenosylcobinamide-GDP ribazoletransferase